MHLIHDGFSLPPLNSHVNFSTDTGCGESLPWIYSSHGQFWVEMMTCGISAYVEMLQKHVGMAVLENINVTYPSTYRTWKFIPAARSVHSSHWSRLDTRIMWYLHVHCFREVDVVFHRGACNQTSGAGVLVEQRLTTHIQNALQIWQTYLTSDSRYHETSTTLPTTCYMWETSILPV